MDTAYGHIATNQDLIAREALAKLDTESAVRTYFSDIPVLIHIARCESTFRHTHTDGTVLKGKVDPADTGVMQINMRYHGKEAKELGLDLTDRYDNMLYARNLYERQGTQPWDASSPCWSRIIAMR